MREGMTLSWPYGDTHTAHANKVMIVIAMLQFEPRARDYATSVGGQERELMINSMPSSATQTQVVQRARCECVDVTHHQEHVPLLSRSSQHPLF